MLGMLGNPKKIASIIIASSPSKEMQREVKGVDKSEDDFDMIAEEMANCIQNKDKSGLASCLKSLFYNMESRLNRNGEVETEDSEEME